MSSGLLSRNGVKSSKPMRIKSDLVRGRGRVGGTVGLGVGLGLGLGVAGASYMSLARMPYERVAAPSTSAATPKVSPTW